MDALKGLKDKMTRKTGGGGGGGGGRGHTEYAVEDEVVCQCQSQFIFLPLRACILSSRQYQSSPPTLRMLTLSSCADSTRLHSRPCYLIDEAIGGGPGAETEVERSETQGVILSVITSEQEVEVPRRHTVQ